MGARFLLVCPASANTIAKLAHGIADNLLTTLALSFENRLIVAPAMNTSMWKNRATQDNVAMLKSRGAFVLQLTKGNLPAATKVPAACFRSKPSSHPCAPLPARALLADAKVLISSGPTAEPLDAVRVITNRSSGKMGAALAQAALFAGAEVCVVSGPSRIPPPAGCRVIRVTTAAQMKAALDAEFGSCDICIMAAAVSDFAPKKTLAGKKRREEGSQWHVDLISNPDIAESLGKKKKHQVLVCFSLEDDNGDARPLAKMKKKKCDLMIVNRVDSSLESDETVCRIIYKGKSPEKLARLPKQQAADIIINRIAHYRGKRHG